MDCGDNDVGDAGVVCDEGKKGDWGAIVWAMVGLVVDDDFRALGEGKEVGHLFLFVGYELCYGCHGRGYDRGSTFLNVADTSKVTCGITRTSTSASVLGSSMLARHGILRTIRTSRIAIHLHSGTRHDATKTIVLLRVRVGVQDIGSLRIS